MKSILFESLISNLHNYNFFKIFDIKKQKYII